MINGAYLLSFLLGINIVIRYIIKYTDPYNNEEGYFFWSVIDLLIIFVAFIISLFLSYGALVGWR
jgi:hypothetical protein